MATPPRGGAMRRRSDNDSGNNHHSNGNIDSSIDGGNHTSNSTGGGAVRIERSSAAATVDADGRRSRSMTREERRSLLSMLGASVVFNRTTAAQRETLVNRMFEVRAAPGDVLLRQGHLPTVGGVRVRGRAY